MIVAFDNDALLPTAWRDGQRLRVFNPGLLADAGGWLLAYRVVAEPASQRRIAICRLDDRIRLIAGSVRPLTDQICFPRPEDYPAQATRWFADPRLYRLGNRLFVYWNSGWHEPQNHQFLQELDPQSLQPRGHPREMVLRGKRQKLEKNWVLFQADRLYAIYSVNPHRVLTFSLEGDGPIEFSDAGAAIANPGGYAQVHGGLRGGSPPQLVDGAFYSFCHSIENDAAGYQYVPAVYRFAAESPFLPIDMPHAPLALAIPSEIRRKLPKLNPAVGGVVYPAGAAFQNGNWLVSIGIDDERCAIAIVPHAVVLRTLSP